MDNTTLQSIQDSIQKSKIIAVTVGSNPSIDEMGSALALFLSVKEMGKNVSVYSASEPIVELSNLVGIDKVKTRFEGEGADLVVSFPYKEGEIEKVSYTIENNYLNIVVKAGEQGLSFSEQDVKYTRGSGVGGQIDLLFVVGTQRLSDIQQIFNPEVMKDTTIINIDNKHDNQGFGDIVLVSPRFSSVSEQVTQLLGELRTPINNDIAQNLLDGILYSTENFQSAKTSYLAFEMAGVLMRQGAFRSQLPPVRQDRQPVLRNQPVQQHSQQQRRQYPQQGQDRRQQFDQRRNQPRQNQGQNYNQNQQYRHNQQQQNMQQQSQNQPVQPVQHVQPVSDQQLKNTQPVEDLNPPTDWLTPKVYKGSSNV